MDFFYSVILLSSIMTAIVYITLFTDEDSPGISGHLHRCFFGSFGIMSDLLRTVFGDSVHDRVSNIFTYFLYEPNPFLQIVYLTLVCGGYALFATYGIPFIPNPYVSYVHIYTSFAVVFINLVTYIIACGVPPNLVSPENMKVLDVYPYDQILYKESRCKTCKFRKIARSKHCSVCNRCVARFDHHCGWLNQCVGQGNYPYFLLFLYTTCILLGYGSYLTSLILYSEVKRLKLYSASYIHQDTGESVPASFAVVYRYVIYIYPVVFVLWALCVIMGVVLLGFLFFHLWLAAQNKTTNEFFKWRYYCARRKKNHSTEETKDVQNIYQKSLFMNMVEAISTIPSSSHSTRKKKRN